MFKVHGAARLKPCPFKSHLWGQLQGNRHSVAHAIAAHPGSVIRVTDFLSWLR